MTIYDDYRVLSVTKASSYLDVNVGLYRDDGLATCTKTPKQVEAIKKEMCKIFKRNSLHITIEANKKVVDFLDITLDLRTEIYKPYKKPNSNLTYIHKQSNHSPSIIKNLPNASTNAYVPILKMLIYSLKHAPHTQKPKKEWIQYKSTI